METPLRTLCKKAAAMVDRGAKGAASFFGGGGVREGDASKRRGGGLLKACPPGRLTGVYPPAAGARYQWGSLSRRVMCFTQLTGWSFSKHESHSIIHNDIIIPEIFPTFIANKAAFC